MPLSWVPVCLGILLGYPSAGTESFAPDPTVFSPEAVVAAPSGQEVQTPQTRVQVDEYLNVSARNTSYDPLTKTYTFTGDVVAVYELETVRADRLVVNMEEMTANATGNVRLDDPEGSVSAEALSFAWKPEARRGTAENVVAHIANVTVMARRAEIGSEKWEFFDVSGTSCRNDPPLLQLRTRHLTVYPEKWAKAEKPSVYVLGRHLLTIPDRSFNLNPRTEGFNPPSLSYRKGNGFGIAFRSGFLLNSRTNLVLNYSAFPSALPNYGAVWTRSFLAEEDLRHLVTPRSELSERFNFGYMENIQVSRPEDEQAFLRRKRSSVSFASLWNQGTSARSDPAHYSKPFEAVYERGGAAEGLAWFGQARMQSIRRDGEDVNARMILTGSVALDPKPLAKNLSAVSRVDTSLFAGPNYGWVRGSLGVVYRPLPQVTLSGSGYASQDFGHSQYDIDQLFSKGGFALRADFDLGPTKFSYLTKWDPSLGIYDREYTASQVVGCLEPFITYRQYPNTYNLGIRFRLDEFYGLLRRRDFHRKPVPAKISPLPNGKP